MDIPNPLTSIFLPPTLPQAIKKNPASRTLEKRPAITTVKSIALPIAQNASATAAVSQPHNSKSTGKPERDNLALFTQTNHLTLDTALPNHANNKGILPNMVQGRQNSCVPMSIAANLAYHQPDKFMNMVSEVDGRPGQYRVKFPGRAQHMLVEYDLSDHKSATKPRNHSEIIDFGIIEKASNELGYFDPDEGISPAHEGRLLNLFTPDPYPTVTAHHRLTAESTAAILDHATDNSSNIILLDSKQEKAALDEGIQNAHSYTVLEKAADGNYLVFNPDGINELPNQGDQDGLMIMSAAQIARNMSLIQVLWPHESQSSMLAILEKIAAKKLGSGQYIYTKEELEPPIIKKKLK